jgi:tetratricopeptide (TPR) repeat protein
MKAARSFGLLLAFVLAPDAQPDSLVREANRVVELRNAGQCQKALDQAGRVIDRLRQRYGEEHENLAWLHYQMGACKYELGQFTEAEAPLRRALEIRLRVLPADHQDIAVSLQELASVYIELDRLDEAEPLYMRALAIRERLIGSPPDESRTSDLHGAVLTLAEEYTMRGRYRDAESLYLRQIAAWDRLAKARPRNVPAKVSNNMGTAMSNLAQVYLNEGRYPEAEHLYNLSLTMHEKVPDPVRRSRNAGADLNGIANVFIAIGRYGDAEALLKRALDLKQKAGLRDRDLIADFSNLADAYAGGNQLAEAESFYKRALAAFGEKRPAPRLAHRRPGEIRSSLSADATLCGGGGAIEGRAGGRGTRRPAPYQCPAHFRRPRGCLSIDR